MEGQEADIGSVRAAQAMGMSTIYQEFNLIPELPWPRTSCLGGNP